MDAIIDEVSGQIGAVFGVSIAIGIIMVCYHIRVVGQCLNKIFYQT